MLKKTKTTKRAKVGLWIDKVASLDSDTLTQSRPPSLSTKR